MKKLAALLAFSTVLAYGWMARAADLPEAPTVYDWTGFYIGGNIGYAFQGGGDDVGVQSNLGGGSIDFGELDVQGINGGAQIGYDWQAGSAVFGIVADIQAADINDDFKNHIREAVLSTDAKDNIDVWGSVRGRIGWAFDRVLIYGTGGLAWANVDYKVFAENLDNGVNAHMNDSYTPIGYTVGGGIDWAFDDNWSAGAEVLYVNLGKESITGKTNNFADTGEILKTRPTPDFVAARFVVNFKF